MTKCIIHIGTEKTGTTSFQRYFSLNRNSLYSQGILYPKSLGEESHRRISTYGLSIETADETVRALGIKTQSEMNEFYKKVEAGLYEELKKKGDISTCIISSEHLHSRISCKDQIERIRNFLDKYFSDICVYVHLRPQIDLITSLASTQSRVGGTVRSSYFNKAQPNQPYFNYFMLVSMWSEIFGSEHITCVPFTAQPDMIRQITKDEKIDETELVPVERLNEALDVRTIAMTNALIDSGMKERIDFRVLDLLPVVRRVTPGYSFALNIQSRFGESNNMLIERREDLEFGQLEPNWSKFPEKGNLNILDESCSFSLHFAHLVKYYNEIGKKIGNCAL